MKKPITLIILVMTASVLIAQASNGINSLQQIQVSDTVASNQPTSANADSIRLYPDSSTIRLTPPDTATFDISQLKGIPFHTANQRSIIPDIPTRTLDTSLPVGSIAGGADVSQTGAATYTIPIEVAPGRNGMQPQLALQYSSQAGNGLAGFGWNLSGLSLIGRCGKSIYYDSDATAPSLSSSDELMLDGSRLLLLSGTRLTSGAHYRLENDPSTDIECKSGSDGVYFTVRKKDGTVMQYGQTVAAQVKNTDTGGVTAYWLLQSVTDKWGNSMSYVYNYSTNYDEFRLVHIYYDGGSVITLEYEDRNDTETYYMAGARFKSSKRLKKIVSSVQNTFSEYRLTYDTTGRYSRLTDITRYGHDGTHYNSTHIDYGGGIQHEEYPAYYSEQRNGLNIAYGDFNGDGRTDYLSYTSNALSGNGSICAFLSAISLGDNVYFQKSDSTQVFWEITSVETADINGDGKSEAIVIVKGLSNVYYYLLYTWTGTLLNYQGNLCSSSSPNCLIGDFNGDGKMDIFLKSEKKVYDDTGTEIASGGINDMGKEYISPYLPNNNFLSDFNGNGKTEILVLDSSGGVVYELSGTTFSQLTDFATSEIRNYYSIFFGDFNGDGKTDVLRQLLSNPSNVSILYSTGKGFDIQSIQNSGIASTVRVGDFNRDGKADIMHFDASGEYYVVKIGINNGNGFTTTNYTSSYLKSSVVAYIDYYNMGNSLIQTGDYDGDGRSDFICTYYNNLAILDTFTDSDQRLAVGISDGLGMQTTFTYSTMNDGGICSNQYNNPSFPLAGITTPLYLVSNIEQSADGYSNSTSYLYEKPQWHMQGRGFLGFAEVAATNTAQDRKVTSTYEVDGTYYYPKLAKQEVKTASGSYISKSEFTYTNKTFSPTKCFFPYASTVVETDYLKGNTVTTTMNADSYGNINSRNTNYGDGTLDALSITFSNTATGSTWILGLPVVEIRVSVNGNGSWMRGRNFTYGSNKELTKTVDYIGTTTNKVSETTYTYDTYGNMTSQSVKPYSATTAQTTSYTYSAPYIFPSSMTDPAGIVTNYSYNLFSELLTESSGGRQHTLTYDGMGRVVSETWSGGKSVQLTRSWDNSLTYSLYKVTTASNADPTSTVWYDAAGRELRTSTMRFDGSDLFQDRTYDSAGRISSVSLPRKNGTAQNDTYTYDSYGRLSSISHAKGGTTSYSYSGNSTTTTGNGISIRRTTNVRGELIESHDACGDITYDLRPDGQPASITAPDNVVTTFSYDNLGRRTAISDPSAGTRTFVYNSDGTLYSQTDADSRTMTMTYDAYLRLSTKTTPQQTYTYTYNSNGLLSSITSTGGSGVELTYDYYQRLSTQKDYAASNKYLLRTFTYTSGNVSQVSYSSDLGNIGTELYTYTNGTLTKVSFAGADVWELDSENSLGQVTAVNSGPLSRGTTYTSNGLLTGITVANGNTTLQNFGYSFSGTTGNLSWRKDMTRNLQESFSYDSMNRLTYCGNGYTTYDAKGNITYQGESYATMQYNDTNKPYAVTGMSSSLTTLPSATQTVTYDGLGRPLSISESGKSALFSYDVDGNRCQMSLYNGSTLLLTRYYSGDRLEEDVTSSGTTARFYVGGDAYTAPAVYVYNGSSWSLHYIGRDHLGSITLVTSSNGTKEYEYSYDAWGRLRNPLNQQVYALGQEPALFLARGYCGHEHLQDFGLINMNARLYDPLTGRFLGPDPYVQAPDFTQSLNRYSYCLNNPLKYVDKNGEIVWFVPIIVGAAIGGTINVIANADNINSIGDVAKYFGVGAIAGGAATAVGMATAGTGFFVGLASGAASGAVSGFILGGGNSYLQNGNFDHFWDDAFSDALMGAAMGGIIGGVTSGISAYHNGRNFWTGKQKWFDIPITDIPALSSNEILPQEYQPYPDNSLVGKFCSDANYAEFSNPGFDTYSKFKSVYGSAGEGMEWHHLVEQKNLNIQKFGPQRIHTLDNIVPIPKGVHRHISGFYSSKPDFLNGLRVRDWMNTMTFEEQREFGLTIVLKFYK